MKLSSLAILIIPALTSCFISCSGKKSSAGKNSRNEIQHDSTAPVYKKPASGFSDTLIIQTKAAVFFKPDSLQFEKIKAFMSKNDYETEVHNCYYQMRNARIELRQYWPQIKIIEAARVRYLLFIRKDKSRTCIDLDGKGDSCGIFLFDTGKEPELIDMMNIDTALGFYFSK